MKYSPPETAEKSTSDRLQGLLPAGILLFICWLGAGLALQSILENVELASSFVSPATWRTLVTGPFGGTLDAPSEAGGSAGSAVVSWLRCMAAVTVLLGLAVCVPLLQARRREAEMLAASLFRLAGWLGVWGLWGVGWIASLLLQWISLAVLLQATVVFWVAVSWAGLLYESLRLLLPVPSSGEAQTTVELGRGNRDRWAWGVVGLLMLGYVVTFTAMNWGLWFNLRLPHGDSAMYEEHLWNVLHGKGFRSYLDQGLFWGEHIQFVHLFLMPLYVVWPSHLLLELCESVAIAAGAIPVFLLARRHSQSSLVGCLLSGAFLLYFPLQFLDIAVDLKTFRPIAFGMAPLLLALDQIERGRFRTATALLAFTLTCKEDYSIPLFSVGLVLVSETLWRFRGRVFSAEQRAKLWQETGWKYGLAYMVAGPVYLWWALRTIRSFRSGVEVHYAGYFTKFGNSTSEIIWTMLTNPSLLLGELWSTSTLLYALAILVPLGFLPLRVPLKLLGCLPMFVLLCLNELASDPRHHFHAPLIPLLFWAATVGLQMRGRAPGTRETESAEVMPVENQAAERNEVDQQTERSMNWAAWVLCCSFSTTLWFSMSPLGVAFWDPHSAWNGARLYWPDERAQQFAKIETLIPQSARVASTDYVHPRFTHYERSYDYSNYARQVSGYQLQVPEDTDYIVIDTRHPYSTIRSPADVRELQQPEKWELLPDKTDGYFLILRRRKP